MHGEQPGALCVGAGWGHPGCAGDKVPICSSLGPQGRGSSAGLRLEQLSLTQVTGVGGRAG